LEVEAKKPLVVAVMGQTGVGKSTLINRLFGTSLKTDPVKPTTKNVEKVVAKSQNGSELWFYDMPGIGEAHDVDAKYLGEYRRILLESDIALWALHADVRSVSFDRLALDQILGSDPKEMRDLLSRITILLTKADHLAPPPWLYVKRGESGVAIPDPRLLEILEAKQRYYFQALLEPYAELLTATTYNDSRWDHELPGFEWTADSVTYRGYLTEGEANGLAEQYPEHSGLLHRLRDTYAVIACSSLLKYNLTPLMTSILTKLGRGAILRFGSQFTEDLSRLTPDEAAACVNLVTVAEGNSRPVVDDTAPSENKKESLIKRLRR
jgi:GTP-binding protein EngB required for normal cell division